MRERLRWGLLMLLSVFAYGSHAPLLALCRVDGELPFATSSVVLATELTKLGASAALLLGRDWPSLPPSAPPLSAVLPFALPAALYALNNNLAVHMQGSMDPVTFQVLGNLKIMATAVARCLLLRQPLSARRWAALALLVVSGACHVGAVNQARGGPEEPVRLFITPLGTAAIALYCSVSGLAATLTERALKSQPFPLSLQNLFLYSFGAIANLVAYLAGPPTAGFFQGFSPVVGVIIASQALNGLLMSAIMKHDSSITRLFIISCSMLVNAGLSVLLFHLRLTPLFFLAACLICFAIHLYYHVR